jgi:hypothetical protein
VTAIEEWRYTMSKKIATVSLTDDELRARRKAILSKLGVSIAELHDRAKNYALVGDEYEAREELDSIAYLLGEPGV